MIDKAVIDKAAQYKREADAAYTVFKKDPSLGNATTWTNASRVFSDYCVKVITDLIRLQTNTNVKPNDILENIEEYKTCRICGAELLFPTYNDSYIASSDFVEAFPGICYNCLVSHCVETDCAACDLVDNPAKCSFVEVKKLHMQEES